MGNRESYDVCNQEGGRHGAGGRASRRCGVAGGISEQRRCRAGAALPGDLAFGAGPELRGGGSADELRAALGRAIAGTLQRLRAGEPRRPAAKERRGADGADARGAGAPGGAAEDAARRRRGVDGEEGGGLHGGRAGAPCLGAARLGSAAGDRLDHPASPASARPGREPRGAGGVQKSSARSSPRRPSAIPAR